VAGVSRVEHPEHQGGDLHSGRRKKERMQGDLPLRNSSTYGAEGIYRQAQKEEHGSFRRGEKAVERLREEAPFLW